MNTNITSGTIARTIILALALVNQLLSVTGHAVLPIEDAQAQSYIKRGLICGKEQEIQTIKNIKIMVDVVFLFATNGMTMKTSKHGRLKTDIRII